MNFEINTVQSPESGSIPLAWAYRHPVLLWTVAWGITGAALYMSGVFNEPRSGPLWIALAGGVITWSIAGSLTFPRMTHGSLPRWSMTTSILWALTYLVSLALAGFFINWAPIRDTITGIFVAIIGWSAGAAFGALISTRLASAHQKIMQSLVTAGCWMLGFFIGGIVVFVVGYIGAELLKIFVGFLIGVPAALIFGFGLGSALGGLVASAIAINAARAVAKSR